MSTVGEWLAARRPAPPPALLGRLQSALGGEARRDARIAGDVCLAAGERLAAGVLRDEQASRDCALDLLAADALITYAFEAMSVESGDLAARAARAMERIGWLGVPVSGR